MAQSESIWDFACRYYAQEGVKTACLIAQDRFGLPVTSLIFALYCVHCGLEVDFEAARVLGAELSAKRVVPLRTARRSLPVQSDLRADSLAAELEAERTVLVDLVDLAVRRAEAYPAGDLSSPATAGEVGPKGSEGASAARDTPSVSFADSSPVGRGSKGADVRSIPVQEGSAPHQSALLAIAGLEQQSCDSDLLDVMKTLALAAQKM